MKTFDEWLNDRVAEDKGNRAAWSACAAEHSHKIKNLEAANKLLKEGFEKLKKENEELKKKLTDALFELNVVTAPPGNGCTVDDVLNYMKTVRKAFKLDQEVKNG